MPGSIQNQRPWNILLVEDDEDDYVLVRACLDGMGKHATRARQANLVWARDSAECLDALRRERFDVILMDFRLGGSTTSGFHVLEQVRSQGYNQPVIFLTGQRDGRAFAEAVSRGATLLLPKDQLEPGHLELMILSSLLVSGSADSDKV